MSEGHSAFRARWIRSSDSRFITPIATQVPVSTASAVTGAPWNRKALLDEGSEHGPVLHAPTLRLPITKVSKAAIEQVLSPAAIVKWPWSHSPPPTSCLESLHGR